MDARELAERIALLLLERGHLYDEDIGYEFGVDYSEVINGRP